MWPKAALRLTTPHELHLRAFYTSVAEVNDHKFQHYSTTNEKKYTGTIESPTIHLACDFGRNKHTERLYHLVMKSIMSREVHVVKISMSKVASETRAKTMIKDQIVRTNTLVRLDEVKSRIIVSWCWKKKLAKYVLAGVKNITPNGLHRLAIWQR